MVSPASLALALAKLAAMAPALVSAGRAAARARLPLVTGYALAGAALGPACARLLTRSDLSALHSIEGAALATVALAAGADLHASEVTRQGKAVACLTLAIALASAGAVAAVVTLVAPGAGRALAGGDTTAIPAAVALASVIAAARSPAAAAAVLRETGGAGPYCALVLAVVVAKDVLVFAVFVIIVELASATAGATPLHAAIARAAGALTVSVAVGTAGGVCLAGALAAWPPPADATTARPGAASRLRTRLAAAARAAVPRAADAGVRAGIVLAAAAATAAGAARGGGEPLLAAVAAGAVAANWCGGGGPVGTQSPVKPRPGATADGDGHDHLPPAPTRLDASLATTSAPVAVVFFALAGASLRLGALPATFGSALIIAAARVAGVVAGSAVGGAAARVPRPVAARVWQGMVTQAGVALGLARAVDRRFAWGPDFAATMVREGGKRGRRRESQHHHPTRTLSTSPNLSRPPSSSSTCWPAPPSSGPPSWRWARRARWRPLTTRERPRRGAGQTSLDPGRAARRTAV